MVFSRGVDISTQDGESTIRDVNVAEEMMA